MSAQPPRFAARSRILTDLAISEGARLLYLYMDDQGRGEPSLSLKRLRMAVILGISSREITRRLAELAKCGYLAIRRTIHTNVYDFAWTVRSLSDVTTESPRRGPAGHIHPIRQESTRTPLPPLKWLDNSEAAQHSEDLRYWIAGEPERVYTSIEASEMELARSGRCCIDGMRVTGGYCQCAEGRAVCDRELAARNRSKPRLWRRA